jgi:hypothetical protein
MTINSLLGEIKVRPERCNLRKSLDDVFILYIYIYKKKKRNACRLELEKKSLTFLQFSLLAFAKLHTQIRPAHPQHYTRRLL